VGLCSVGLLDDMREGGIDRFEVEGADEGVVKTDDERTCMYCTVTQDGHGICSSL
jgi:hypothetical protein